MLIYEGVFLYFCLLENSKIEQIMSVILTTLLFSVLCFFALKQIAKNQTGPENKEEEAKWAPFVMLATALALICNLSQGAQASDAIPFYLSMTLASLYPLISSVVPPQWSKTMVVVLIVAEILAALLTLTAKVFFGYEFRPEIFQCMARLVCCIVAFIFISSVYYRISDMKNVMKSGSVWTVVCTYVDAVYVMVFLLTALSMSVFNVYVVTCLMTLLVVALGLRIMNSSVFVVFTRHERRIIESMKVSQTEFVGESPGTMSLYNNIYERLLEYFEKHQPYLDSDLTINDVADVVLTNKLYISKAISHCTGRNFCQFVNYYRITHAVKMFREDPHLKVVELSAKCGFNTTVSFSTAFRLYMGENPGDWCRKERARLSKK